MILNSYEHVTQPCEFCVYCQSFQSEFIFFKRITYISCCKKGRIKIPIPNTTIWNVCEIVSLIITKYQLCQNIPKLVNGVVQINLTVYVNIKRRWLTTPLKELMEQMTYEYRNRLNAVTCLLHYFTFAEDTRKPIYGVIDEAVLHHHGWLVIMILGTMSWRQNHCHQTWDVNIIPIRAN